MLPQGILFDLDDTIISSTDSGIQAWGPICAEYYRVCRLADPDTLLQAIYTASIWYWSDRERHRKGRNRIIEARREVIRIALERIGIDDMALAVEISDGHSKRREELIRFFPKASETLQRLKKNGVSLALMTNGEAEHQRKKVVRFDLEKVFDVVLIEGEMGFGKPDKRVFHRALEALNLAPDSAWAIGDNLEWDVWGPQQLGIHSIWNDFNQTGLPPSSSIIPDRIIHSIAELIENEQTPTEY